MEKDDAEDLSQMQLFEMLKYDCIAQKRDISFIYDLSERALELKMDVEISEEALGLVASNTVRNESSVESAPLEEIDNGFVAGDGAAFGMDDHLSSSGGGLSNGEKSADNNAAPMMEFKTAKCTTSDVNIIDECQEHINFDELHCFQLRTRVLGLNIPTFNELWRYLQAAGWTYSNGNYHIPKALERSNDRMIYYDTESTMKRMYKLFSLDDTTCDQHTGQQSDAEEFDGEEGPDTFDNPNDLVAYLDEYCMTDYRAIPSEIHAQQIAQRAKSKAYRRRNIQLRFELLEVAYRDRVRKRHEAEMIASQSKYGHNHRPCDVCFKAASSLYPRVACRKCGLIVHTHCYGLLDHGKKDGNARSRAEVDEKGYFTCDVCMYSLADDSVNQKVRYHASESSGWRIHTHPNAVCPLCVKNTIIGGMIRVALDSDDDGGARIANAKHRKRKSRRSSEQSELWVHLFCINALPSRGGSDVDIRIRDALAISFQIVQETEVRPNCEIEYLSVPRSFP